MWLQALARPLSRSATGMNRRGLASWFPTYICCFDEAELSFTLRSDATFHRQSVLKPLQQNPVEDAINKSASHLSHSSVTPFFCLPNIQSRLKLNVQILNVQRVVFDKFAARFDLVAHQHSENLIGFDRVINFDLQQGALFGVHRGFP